jgi:hypothetical protein
MLGTSEMNKKNADMKLTDHLLFGLSVGNHLPDS